MANLSPLYLILILIHLSLSFAETNGSVSLNSDIFGFFKLALYLKGSIFVYQPSSLYWILPNLRPYVSRFLQT